MAFRKPYNPNNTTAVNMDLYGGTINNADINGSVIKASGYVNIENTTATRITTMTPGYTYMELGGNILTITPKQSPRINIEIRGNAPIDINKSLVVYETTATLNGNAVATLDDIPNVSGLAPKVDPVFSGTPKIDASAIATVLDLAPMVADITVLQNKRVKDTAVRGTTNIALTAVLNNGTAATVNLTYTSVGFNVAPYVGCTLRGTAASIRQFTFTITALTFSAATVNVTYTGPGTSTAISSVPLDFVLVGPVPA